MIINQPSVHDPNPEEQKTEVLEYLASSCWLVDTIEKQSTETRVVKSYNKPAFFSESSAWFDFPKPVILQEMIEEGLIDVHVSPWFDGDFVNPNYDLRSFRITEKGRNHISGSFTS